MVIVINVSKRMLHHSDAAQKGANGR